MKKALIIATIYPFINGFEQNNIILLKNMGYEIHTFANGISSTKNLDTIGVIKNTISITRNPFSVSNLKSICKIRKYIRHNHISLIHCHTPVGGFLGRISCIGLRNTKVIYTAHGFHFYKGAPIKNWILYYTIEKILSNFTDALITINNEDFNFARKKFKNTNVYKINGIGLDVEKIKSVKIDKEAKKRELGVDTDTYIIMSVGELNENKNHQAVIKALEKFEHKYIYIICGVGPLDEMLKEMAKERNVNLKLLGFRNDIFELLQITNLFIFPSYREGLPVSLMEAVSLEVPCLASNIRGCNELLEKEFLFNQSDILNILAKINYIYFSQENFRQKNIEEYYLENVKKKMKQIYIETINKK